MNKYIIQTGVLIISLSFTLLLAVFFGHSYYLLIGKEVDVGGALPKGVALFFIGLPFSYSFFISLYFSFLRSYVKYLLLVVFLIPPLWYEYFLNKEYIQIIFVYVIVGWICGGVLRSIYLSRL